LGGRLGTDQELLKCRRVALEILRLHWGKEVTKWGKKKGGGIFEVRFRFGGRIQEENCREGGGTSIQKGYKEKNTVANTGRGGRVLREKG